MSNAAEPVDLVNVLMVVNEVPLFFTPLPTPIVPVFPSLSNASSLPFQPYSTIVSLVLTFAMPTPIPSKLFPYLHLSPLMTLTQNGTRLVTVLT